jgi:molecular chaperone GrpE
MTNNDTHPEPRPELVDENAPGPEDTIESLLDPGLVPEVEPAEVELIEPLEINVGETAAELGLELPEDPALAQAMLLRQLAETRQESGEYLQTLQRVAADFENYRKRVERDHAENITRASQRVLEDLLPTLDSFDAALAHEPQSPREEKILDGLRGTYGLLMETLARESFEAIAAAGAAFDPAVHEAVAGPGEGDGDLVVEQELRRGYTLRGRVIRPSLVTVGHA